MRFTLVREGERYATAAVPFAEDEPLDLVAAAGASKLVRLGDGSRFVERVIAPEMVDLPVRKGQKLGEIVRHGRRRGGAPAPIWSRPVTSRSRASASAPAGTADRALDEAGDILSSVIPGI